MSSSWVTHEYDMAIGVLKHLINNIPGWQSRLTGLSKQLDRRQGDLATMGHQGPNIPGVRLPGPKSSCEPLNPTDSCLIQWETDGALGPQRKEPDDTLDSFHLSRKSTNCVSLDMSAKEILAVAPLSARAQTSKMLASASTGSAERSPAYQPSERIVVYYDSYVQSFFDQLVLFVSMSRNIIRKSRMSITMAQMKRMIESDEPEDGNHPHNDRSVSDSMLSLRDMAPSGYMSTPWSGIMSTSRRLGLGSFNSDTQGADIHQILDEKLDVIQCACERGAYKFLRNAKCEEELNRVREGLDEVLQASVSEMERVQRRIGSQVNCGEEETRNDGSRTPAAPLK
ncbi:hypothetical protein Purlil1_12712 [Purpureocillium lilacinum]|uniref:Uncharacterized protein n=1 Tax=Purpureocillium lilacinum TaxID=33203 RepID=A0ABR0BGA4_PURLI|nr:hypothetical protein Purlil1_12712 [Purpureocillium lilacinum]